MSYRQLSFVLSLCFLGCDVRESPPDSASAHSVRDSAGVRIVEVADLDHPLAEWRLSPDPELVIGSINGPPAQQLFQAFDASRLPDGSILVANSGTFELRKYDPQGRHLWSEGAEGNGPGEFRSLSLIDVVRGDSIYVWDQRAMRVSVLDPVGRFARSSRLTIPEEQSIPRYWAAFEDGSFLVRVTNVASTAARDRSVSNSTTTLMHYSSEGQPLDTIAAVPNESQYRIMHPGGGGISFFPVPFSPGGTGAADGIRVHTGTGKTYEVRTWGQGGDLIRILRGTVETTPVTKKLFESYVADQLSQFLGDDGWRKFMVDAYADMTPPEVARVFDAMEVDAVGHLWVRRTPMPGDELRQWDVLDAEGRYVARAVIPAGFRVREIGANYVLGIRRDELGVEQVALFRIQKKP
jgi:hypothetical protein